MRPPLSSRRSERHARVRRPSSRRRRARPRSLTEASPGPITAGPHGNSWFTEHIGTGVGRIPPARSGDGVPARPRQPLRPGRIAKGPVGVLWFTETGGNRIGGITPSGVASEFRPRRHPKRWLARDSLRRRRAALSVRCSGGLPRDVEFDARSSPAGERAARGAPRQNRDSAACRDRPFRCWRSAGA
jgi:hypothetical protein